MDPVTIGLALAAVSSAVAGGASYLGAKETNSANAALNRQAMGFNWGVDQWQMANQWAMMRESETFNSTEAEKARMFQDSMSSTSYQRARSDMLAAGLNPILAYAQGGASTPSGASASVGTPSASAHGAPALQRMENALGPAVGSAVQAAQTVMGLQQIAAQVDQTKAQTALAGAQEEQARSQAALNSATAITEAQRTGLVKSQRASEMVLPSLRQAQTSAASAAAAEATERAITEPRRRPLIDNQALEAAEGANRNQAQAGLARSQAGYTETQDRQRQLYGPPGPVSSTVGGISQIWDNVSQAARNQIRTWLR